MKQISIFFIFILCIQNNFAQDKLVKTNSEIILAKVLEITPTEVKYKTFDNLNGPIYTVDKSNFVSVIYENGKIEAIVSDDLKKLENQKNRPRFKSLNPFYKNSFDFDLLSFYTADVSLQYTHYLKNERFAITVPFRIGWQSKAYNGLYLVFNNFNYDYNYYPYGYLINDPKGFKLLTGVNFKYFFRDAVKFRGYVAPEIFGGYSLEKNKIGQYDNNYVLTNTIPVKYNTGTVGVMGVLGFIGTPHPRVSIKCEIAIGYAGLIGKTVYQKNVPIGRMVIAIGYNFNKKRTPIK